MLSSHVPKRGRRALGNGKDARVYIRPSFETWANFQRVPFPEYRTFPLPEISISGIIKRNSNFAESLVKVPDSLLTILDG